jgi:TRAP-type C4-dicarboxylate transport system permease small subunit
MLTAEKYVGRAVELVAGLLIAAEIVILFAGVISRYFLQQPLVWSDELASLLFLWLAILGAVVAFRRNEHMRMTALVGMTSPRVRAFLEAISIAAVLAFLLFLIEPAYEFASEEIEVSTPALELSNAWRAFALPIGLVLMALMALAQLISIRNWTVIAVGVGTVVVVAAVLAGLGPVLRGLGNLNLLIFFVGITGLLVLGGVPIAFSFGRPSGFAERPSSCAGRCGLGRSRGGGDFLQHSARLANGVNRVEWITAGFPSRRTLPTRFGAPNSGVPEFGQS